jgi:stage II sporulation protein D
VQNVRGQLHWQAGDQTGQAGSLFLQPLDPGEVLRWEGAPYYGEFLLIPAGEGVTVVNVVEMEAYLCGVVPWEIGRHERPALAALEAQAVAARTYTLAHLGEREALGFDVWADVQDQVYRGADGLDDLCNEAVGRTAGLVLEYSGQEIEAYYCSTCGGWTSDVAEVWPRPARPYLRSHPDAVGDGQPFCAGARHYSWETTWDSQDLQRLLAQSLPEYLDYLGVASRAAWAGEAFTPRTEGADPRRPGRLWSLVISQRTSSGRIGRLDVATDAGVYHVRGDRIRWVLRPADGEPAILRSALFQLETKVNQQGRLERITARGRGFGHGVGLCQTGALAMARQGYSCREILAHYYPGARMKPYADLRAR